MKPLCCLLDRGLPREKGLDGLEAAASGGGYECVAVDVFVLPLLVNDFVEEVVTHNRAQAVHQHVDLAAPRGGYALLDVLLQPRKVDLRRQDTAPTNTHTHTACLCMQQHVQTHSLSLTAA